MANKIVEAYVKCIRGTSGNSIPGGALKYWEKQTGLRAGLCSCVGCSKPATDGAHVIVTKYISNGQWVNHPSREQYIIPMCHKCNEQEGEAIHVRAIFVPVAQG